MATDGKTTRENRLDTLMDSLLDAAIEAMEGEPNAALMGQAINLLKLADYEVVGPKADTKPQELKNTLEQLKKDMEADDEVVVPFTSR